MIKTTTFENLIVLRSMSKGFGIAGLRCAYLAVSQKLAPYYDKIDLGFEPNYIGIQTSIELLNNYTWFIEESIQLINKIKPKFIQFLESKNIKVFQGSDDSSIFLCHHPTIDLYVQFSDIGVLTSSGEGFSSSLSTLNNNYIRFLCPNSEIQLNQIISRYNQKYA